LDCEVAARNAFGAQLRIRAAGLPVPRTLEEFDWDAQSAVRPQIAAAHRGHRVLFATATDWITRLTDAHRAGRLPDELTGCAATG
jgi:DNA replication protein DnaC